MAGVPSSGSLPVIEMSPLFDASRSEARRQVARDIEQACRDTGFFYVSGHGVPDALLARMEELSHRFFALPREAKEAMDMARGGAAWRGWFPLGGELTSGKPDRKEGLYLGTELGPEHPRVKAGWPLHGANLWPEDLPELRGVVLEYMDRVTRAAHALMEGVAESLGLERDYFHRAYTADPTVLFRIFHYPAEPEPVDGEERWGVGGHTDYGLLTLLAQDTNGGLQVKSRRGWVEAPPIPGTLVCNIGDMLDRLTGGWYRSTPHRVKNVSGRDRLSFPLFFDPDFAAEVPPLPNVAVDEDRAQRWDGASVHAFSGTYGDYLLGKVSKVFPQLVRRVL
ncbi:isopenicillin N synthase family oxygenase [Myxococcus sp. AB025B]|uniref:isopenicillin N synthase family dioxygenase n=1 Tax=Myxococcus sp. AB025B TaxID=2562794 RepID=UPI001144931E|nr:2-oxoglutarate and iron-dependent oxygenase domain-containing protein [Myxococcus sp. AB025B]